MAATKTKLDEKWFRLMIDRADESLRSFAAKMGLDPAIWHRTLKGTRRMQLEEIQRAAQILGVPVEDVLRHTGMKIEMPKGMHGVATSVEPLPVLGGTIDASGLVVFSGLDSHGAGDEDVRALQITGDPFLEGRYLLYKPSEVAKTPGPGQSMGLVKMKDGRVVFRKLRPGFSAGRWDLGPALGFGEREDDAEIVGVIPVVGLRF